MNARDHERFNAKIEITDSCWIWTAGKTTHGYGTFERGRRHPEGKKTLYAHRVSYELHKGAIPDGMHIDHLCRNPSCVNPDHLEVVLPRENCRRGKKGVLLTHCAQGHPYTEENTLYNFRGWRYCRECNRINCRDRYWQVKAQRQDLKAEVRRLEVLRGERVGHG